VRPVEALLVRKREAEPRGAVEGCELTVDGVKAVRQDLERGLGIWIGLKHTDERLDNTCV
jgi:hypothetical protein